MADIGTEPGTNELGLTERDLGIANPDRVLFTPELKKVFEKAQDQEAFDSTVSSAVFLLSQTADPEKSAPAVSQMLDGVDFNDKQAFKGSGGYTEDKRRREINVNLAINLWEQQTGLHFNGNFDDAIKIGSEVMDKLERTFYHGTNTVALDGIKRLGLIIGEKGYEQDIEALLEIFKHTGKGDQILGWYKLNSEGNVFMSGSIDGALDYAQSSPEWFEQFTSNGHEKNPYRIRDYEEAKRFLESRTRNWNNRTEYAPGQRALAGDEVVKVMQFFEKYWGIYGNSDPVIVQINRSKLIPPLESIAATIRQQKRLPEETFQYNDGDEKAAHFIRQHGSQEDIREALSFRLGAKGMYADVRVSEDIPIDNLRYYVVPRFSKT